MPHRQPKLGEVVQFTLPDSTFAYGRILKDGGVALYEDRSVVPGQPPLGSNRYVRVVRVFFEFLRSDAVPIVGIDPVTFGDDDWPPPTRIGTASPGRPQIYDHGQIRRATHDEVRDLYVADFWDLDDVIQYLSRPKLGTHEAGHGGNL